MLSLCFIRATPPPYSFALSMPNHVLSVLEAAYLELNIDDPPQVRFLTSWWRRGGSGNLWRSPSPTPCELQPTDKVSVTELSDEPV